MLTLAVSCRKNQGESGCGQLPAALMQEDRATVQTIVAAKSRVVGRIPETADASEIGSKLRLLADNLNDCGMIAELLCALCIDTNPAMSEIQLQFTINGTPAKRTIDLFAEPGHYIEFVSIHE